MGFEDIYKRVPCRNKEVEQLIDALGKQNDNPCASLFVVGHKSCGKSFTVRTVLELMNLEHVIISCIEAYTPCLLFDPILSQFIGGNQDEEEMLIETRCEDMMSFIQQLNNKAVEDVNFRNKKRVIVLEEAEYLRDMAPNLLPAFLKLQEISLLKRICVILISSLPWKKFRPSDGLSCPVEISFPQYTQNEVKRILLLDCPSKYPVDLYQHYLHLFLSVFWRFCHDIRELGHKATINFAKYCEPIERGEADVQDGKQLWQYIAPHFKSSLQVIYMRTEMKEAQSVTPEPDSSDHIHQLSASAKFALSFELPFFAKYLLIAAYIASYNSPKEDKKMFVKLSGRKKKQMPKQSKNKSAKPSLQVIGPKVFDMGRLLAIFYAIIETKPRLSVNLLSQISTLVELQLLHRTGDDALENPKFKCAVGLDFIIIIARTLNFSVTKYLADYK